ncbi:MAG TPA: hypothetical protein VE954_03955 [Oligoflexus sp.]|nr:hypothetical protein [Oligoflexus sp.]HYX32241.1 hypothetical protein [Oligoflexus sp.]
MPVIKKLKKVTLILVLGASSRTTMLAQEKYPLLVGAGAQEPLFPAIRT